MPRVTPKHPNETFEVMHNRFKRLVDKAGTMDDYYKHEFYEKPSKTRARARAAAIKRQERTVRESATTRPTA